MPAFVGEMFSTGAMPWHRQGKRRETLANVDEAIVDGGLNWTVDYDDLVTKHEKASPVPNRKAVVRLDKPPGDEGRVLGVVHRGFRAIPNTEAARIVDDVFGKGKPVYETGGYLGRGEVIWLLARIDRPLNIGGHDEVVPYALMLNSHDGSRAFQIRLTTVRVVCQNTLNAAMRERKFGKEFRRSHSGSINAHMVAADEFYRATLREIDEVERAFNLLRVSPCSDDQFSNYLEILLPLPKPPSQPSTPLLEKSYERRLLDVQVARETILDLVETGKGTTLPGVRGTLWGAMNAIIEYSDFHSMRYSGRVDRVLIGDGANFKAKAYQLALELAQAV